YSEASAQRRIQSARLLRQIPEVGESIVAGRLNMTQLSQVQMMVRQKQSAEQVIVSAEEKISLISAIESKTSFETELILSKALDVPIKKLETARPQQDDSLRLEMTLSADLLKKMEQVKSLFSHVKHNPSWSELLELLADFAISKKSASRSVRERKSQLPDCESITENNEEMLTRSRSVAECSRYIPAQIRRDLLKQNPCCQFVSPVTGVKCKSRFQLQIDHVVPFSVSGDSSVANLRVLCRAHNLSEAAQWGLNIPH
ncbi:MAG: HNH endonuclease, partial [Bdellovibrionaceae bacterium]|nr:HNH endonuclease [Pseudobdellovibrionaceae bacterium]